MAEGNFEKDLERLEEIVGALEEGGLSLDDSLKQFELGIKLARRCEKALSEAEKRIEILTKKPNGELVAEPFEDDAEVSAPTESKGRGKRSSSSETLVDEKAATEDDEDADEDEEGNGALLF